MINQTDDAVRSSRPLRKQEPTIAILVLGCLLPVYDRCIRSIRATWASKTPKGVEVFYVYGGQGGNANPEMLRIEDLIGQDAPELNDFEVWVSGDIILCGAGDVYAQQRDCILRKRLIAFGYLAHQGRFDFIYAVCASSYVDICALQRYVRTLPPTGIYQGPPSIHAASGSPFVSGASILMSRDIAALLSDSAEAIIAANTDFKPDDVAIGRWIADMHCPETSAEICDRIAAGKKATDDHAFVNPHGLGLINFVHTPVSDQLPCEKAYHYHFHSKRMWELERFHNSFFTAERQRYLRTEVQHLDSVSHATVIKSRPRNVIVVGNWLNDQWRTNSRQSIAAVARRWGVPIVELTEPLGPDAGGFLEKLWLDKHCESFDRVIWFDRDIVVRYDCPNLFDIVRSGHFGCVSSHQDPFHVHARARELQSLFETHDASFDHAVDHLNTGVMVFDAQMHANLFREARTYSREEPDLPFFDQPSISLAVKKSGCRQLLEHSFNRCGIAQWPGFKPIMTDYIWHFCGMKSDQVNERIDATRWRVPPLPSWRSPVVGVDASNEKNQEYPRT